MAHNQAKVTQEKKKINAGCQHTEESQHGVEYSMATTTKKNQPMI